MFKGLWRPFATNTTYTSLTHTAKHKFVPQTRENIKTPNEFLKAIGRDCESVADKFTSWEKLFTTSSREMSELGIKTGMRKHILSSRNWFCQGRELDAVEIPKRRNKYLKLKAQVKYLRLKKLGLA